MRIAIVHEMWGAGAARCAQDLCGELRKRHDVSYFPRSSDDSAAEIEKELSRLRPNIVHCHSFYGSLPYESLSDIANLYPTCFTVHDPRPIGTMDVTCWNCIENATCRRCPLLGSAWRQLLRNPYYQQRRLKRRVHKRCPATMQVVAPSLWMAGRLKATELSRFSIRHIPNGIDLVHFTYHSNARAEFGLPIDRPVILFSAWHEGFRNIGRRKGLADLAEAFTTHIVSVMPGAVLAVAGESFVPNHPNVRPLGLVTIDRMPRLLSAVDVYVLPTLADNFPYVVLEAMACGLPVVATYVGGIPEQIKHGENGLLVPAGQPAAIGAAVLEILSDPGRAKAMGAKSRARAEALYSMEAFVGAYERLFEELAGAADIDKNSPGRSA
jgi:glycosyltransferase involved in cell wall biosynthesis